MPHKKYLLLTITLFSIVGAIIVRPASGMEAITWMNIYQVSDFDNFSKTYTYIKNLMVPIPPILSLAEIAAYNIFGSTYLITDIIYPTALVLCFVCSIFLASSSTSKILTSAILSIIFLWGIVIIHWGNPQTYDIFFPLFSLLYIAFIKIAPSQSPSKMALLCMAAGLCLSMAELMRPFVFFLLPIFIFLTYQHLKKINVKYFFYFMIPILLFTGVWHFYILVQHGQITWTNHSGFNLIRAWIMVEMPPLIPEIHDQPLGLDRWPNLNTIEHYQNSQAIQHAILEYIFQHPIESIRNIIGRLVIFLLAQTDIYYHQPKHWSLFLLYKPCVWISSLWLLRNAVLLGIASVKKRNFALLSIPENLLIVMAVSYIFILAVGESGEEARLLISVLPLIAALPSYSPDQTLKKRV